MKNDIIICKLDIYNHFIQKNCLNFDTVKQLKTL
jgi:hypothetical protein